MVSTIPNNPVFTERVRPCASGHVAGRAGSWHHWGHVPPTKVPRWLRAPQPPCHSLQDPDVPPPQHLGSISRAHYSTGWVNQTMKQMVELNGTNRLAFHDRCVRAGPAALARTATARECCSLYSYLFPFLGVRHVAAAPKPNSSTSSRRGRAMVVRKRNVQLKHSEKISY